VSAVCSVIELLPEDREGVVHDGLSPIEAEIPCEMKVAEMPRATIAPAPNIEETGRAEQTRRRNRQLAPKF
jgi:hypothetical protein